MKLNRILSIALLIPAMVALNSCADDYAVDTDYTPAEVVDGPQVYFHETISTDVPVTEAEPNFSIDFYRVSSESEDVVELKLEAEEGVLELFEMPDFVTFAAGSKVATLQCKALFPDDEHMPYDKVFPVKISVAKAEDATLYAYSSLTFNIVRPAPWKSLGMGKMMDAFIYDNKTYFEVEIQQNELDDTRFRVVKPYDEMLELGGYIAGGAYSAGPSEYFEFQILPVGYDFKGYIVQKELVMYDDVRTGYYHPTYAAEVYAVHPIYFKNGVLDYNAVLDYQKNGLPGEVSIAPFYYMDGIGGWDKSGSTCISILFPDYVKGDYSASVDYTGIYTAKDGIINAVANLSLGKDAQNVKAIVMPADADAAAVADAIAAGELEAIDVVKGRIEVPFNAEELGGNNFQIIVTVLLDGAVKTIANSSFEYFGGGKSPWQSLGTGYYTDDILSSGYGLPPVTYEVEVLENNENPGMYRLVNPYNNKVYPAEYVQAFAEQLGNSLAPEGYYLEVNAMDAEGVYIQRQFLGLDFGNGEWAFESEGAYYLSYYLPQGVPFEAVKNAGFLGKAVDGVIKFPTFSKETGEPTDGAGYQGTRYMGEGAYYSGINSKIEIVLPGANAFARNMAKAKVNNSVRNAGKLSPAGIKASRKRAKFFNRTVETFATPNF